MTNDNPPPIPSWRRRRAEAYARSPVVKRPASRSRFVRFSGAAPGDHVLDVGTGPGFSAFPFARRSQRVTGLDWRPELLEVARREAARRRINNVTFVEAAPSALPFPDGSFDLVVSAAALHHFGDPEGVLSEMARVCRDGGSLALEDVLASEQAIRARYHNRIERLRDRSHQRLLALSEIVAFIGKAGLIVSRVEVLGSLREFNEWIAVTRPPFRRAEHIRRLLQGSVEQDLSGLAVQPDDDSFVFLQQVAWIRAEKPE
ncbi:MAG TPA: class I SAM-dependent methyltransferase [Dehalococcoidia bacterium]|nr:class I SAM-dependent methyltransferase [Dehalococcoidia bacterium]